MSNDHFPGEIPYLSWATSHHSVARHTPIPVLETFPCFIRFQRKFHGYIKYQRTPSTNFAFGTGNQSNTWLENQKFPWMSFPAHPISHLIRGFPSQPYMIFNWLVIYIYIFHCISHYMVSIVYLIIWYMYIIYIHVSL